MVRAPTFVPNSQPDGFSSTPSGTAKSSSSKRQQAAAAASNVASSDATQAGQQRQQPSLSVMSVGSQPSAQSTAVGPKQKKRRIGDRILPPEIRDLVPESQAYMDLLAFERKLDATISRKRLDIQEALKRPMKVKRKLRIYVSNTFYPGKEPVGTDADDGTVPSWELRVEGRLVDELQPPPNLTPQQREQFAKQPKRKFSWFFKSLVIELDKDIYGPDNHLVEWHRTATTHETDGFQVKRPGDRNVKCTILLLLDYQPMKFKLDPRLARLLGIHTDTRPKIIEALWQYIKTYRLQDPHERDYINCDRYLEQIFQTQRMRFMEIPTRLHQLLHSPDPIVINHLISVEGLDAKKTSCYDIDVEIDDPLKAQMSQFLMSQQSQNEISGLDSKIQETVEQIQNLKTNREFYLGFSSDPQEFIQKWLISQSRDLKIMTDVVGQPEAERKSEFFEEAWVKEAAGRYFYSRLQARKSELDNNLGIRNN